MTTFRCRTVSLNDVKYAGVSSVDPDGIGMEVETNDGLAIFDLFKWRDGHSTVCVMAPPSTFPNPSGFEIDLRAFRAMIDRCIVELDEWETKLRASDGPWSDSCNSDDDA